MGQDFFITIVLIRSTHTPTLAGFFLLVRASCVRHTLLVYHCFHACSFFLLSSFFLSAHPSLQPPTKNSRKQKLLGSALVTERSSGKLSGSPQGLFIPLPM